MLDDAYSKRFNEIVDQLDYKIELPRQWKDYFDESGDCPAYTDDQRSAKRIKVRTHGLLYHETFPKFCCRTKDVAGIYTRDFSRRGIGILTANQLMPEETFRVILPTFWLRARAVRIRRLTGKCFEVGCQLMQRYDPAEDAFEMPPAASSDVSATLDQASSQPSDRVAVSVASFA